MISSKRFIAIFASIFLLASLPLLLGPPNGRASAGLSAGFLLPIEQLWQMAILVSLGVYSAHLRSSQAMVLLPLSFILMYVVGMSVAFDANQYPLMPFFLLGSVMLLAISFILSRSEHILIGMIITASFGFHFGTYYYGLIPPIAEPLYFMLGNILALSLIFCAAVSLGITFLRPNRRASTATR